MKVFIYFFVEIVFWLLADHIIYMNSLSRLFNLHNVLNLDNLSISQVNILVLKWFYICFNTTVFHLHIRLQHQKKVDLIEKFKIFFSIIKCNDCYRRSRSFNFAFKMKHRYDHFVTISWVWRQKVVISISIGISIFKC